MFYTIRHLTRFRYTAPITQSVMEVRMQPRHDATQRCLTYTLKVQPHARVLTYQDYLGNQVQHFDIPTSHRSLTITANAQVEVKPTSPVPYTIPFEAWEALPELAQQHYEMVVPSRFTHSTPLLAELARTLDVETIRQFSDPLTLLYELNTAIYNSFDYSTDHTEVDSPIDDALQARRGVCQDFTHILLALVRPLGIPCRYVSGYLFHRNPQADDDEKTQADRSADDASHAWVEALLPELGWVGFDPTNNLIAGERHIRVAVGRDYADVPPTRGVFQGTADTQLSVAVRVSLSDDPTPTDALTDDELLKTATQIGAAGAILDDQALEQALQMEQAQQIQQ